MMLYVVSTAHDGGFYSGVHNKDISIFFVQLFDDEYYMPFMFGILCDTSLYCVPCTHRTSHFQFPILAVLSSL